MRLTLALLLLLHPSLQEPRDLALVGLEKQKTGDFRGALADYTRALEGGLNHSELLLRRGECRAALGEHALAVEDFDRAIAGGERGAVAFLNRGWSRFQGLDVKGAISDATRSLQADPVLPKAYRNRFLAYGAFRSWENALRDHRKATELEGRLYPEAALLAWAFRSRQGEREKADAELREHAATLPKDATHAWMPRVMAFALGDLSEEEFLEEIKSAEAPGPRVRACDGRYFMGVRRLLRGDAAGARPCFEQAAEAGSGGGLSALARWEIEMARNAERKPILEDLEGKLRGFGPFRAEFELAGAISQDGSSLSGVVLHADLAGGRLLVELKGIQEGREFTAWFSYEGMTFRFWSTDGKAFLMETESLFKGMEDWETGLLDHADRILPPPPGKVRDPVFGRGLHLEFVFEGKPAADREGSIRFACGKATHPSASWLREPRRKPSVSHRVEEKDVVFEFPSRKRIVVSRETGFVRSLRVEDYDGTVREARVRSLGKVDAFPDVKRPERFDRAPFDFGPLLLQWGEQASRVGDLLSDLLERWDLVRRDGKEKEVPELLTRWGARYLDFLRTCALKSLARSHVKGELDRGIPLAGLSKEAELARFRDFVDSQKEGVEAFLKGRLEQAAWNIETAVIETPVDSRLHGTLAELVRSGLSHPTVDAARAKAYGDRLESVYREELDANRKL